MGTRKKINFCNVNETSDTTKIRYTDCYAHLNFTSSVTVYQNTSGKKIC